MKDFLSLVAYEEIITGIVNNSSLFARINWTIHGPLLTFGQIQKGHLLKAGKNIWDDFAFEITENILFAPFSY